METPKGKRAELSGQPTQRPCLGAISPAVAGGEFGPAIGTITP